MDNYLVDDYVLIATRWNRYLNLMRILNRLALARIMVSDVSRIYNSARGLCRRHELLHVLLSVPMTVDGLTDLLLHVLLLLLHCHVRILDGSLLLLSKLLPRLQILPLSTLASTRHQLLLRLPTLLLLSLLPLWHDRLHDESALALVVRSR